MSEQQYLEEINKMPENSGNFDKILDVYHGEQN